MRFYQQILLVLALTLGMIAAGVAWERFYVSPLVEQAQRKPDPPGFATDDLPAACLEELSTMESSSTAMDSRADKPLVAGRSSRANHCRLLAAMSCGAARSPPQRKYKPPIPRHPWH